MTRIQGWVVVALLAVLAVNFLVLDFVVINMIQGISEMSSEVPADYPTESIPTITCDNDPSCEEPTE